MQYLFAMNEIKSVQVLYLVIQLEPSSYICIVKPQRKECDAMF